MQIAISLNPIDWKVRSAARQKDFPLDLPAIRGDIRLGGQGGMGGLPLRLSYASQTERADERS